MAIDSGTTQPRSRRTILAGALGGVAGLIAARFGTADSTKAASGDPLILGSLTNNSGVTGTKLSTNGTDVGLYVQQNGTGTALRGIANNGIAGFFTSSNGTGISGVTAKNNQFGVYGANDAVTNGGGEAIRANGQQNHGLVATTANASAYGHKAINSAVNGRAILGQAPATTGSTGIGVVGQADGDAGSGVHGLATSATGTPNGVRGVAGAPAANGVYGQQTAATYGDGAAVRADGGVNHGVVATSNGGYAVKATASGFGTGIFGSGAHPIGTGVVGVATASTDVNYGVYGSTASASGYGVYSGGNARVFGDLDVTGTISGATNDFRIDHPLDPASKFLSHSCVESDDRRTVYDGEVTLDARGEATVVLQAWFGALNGQTRIQLTPIGPTDRILYVKTKVSDNRFDIGGGASGQEVYWHLTAIRQDPYAKAHPLAVEAAKTGAERGRYLHPEVYGKPASKSIDALHVRPLPVAAPTGAPAPATGH